MASLLAALVHLLYPLFLISHNHHLESRNACQTDTELASKLASLNSDKVGIVLEFLKRQYNFIFNDETRDRLYLEQPRV